MKYRYFRPSLENSKKGVAPRKKWKKTLHAHPVILAILVLVFIIPWICPISATVLDEHIFGRITGPDQRIESTIELTRDDMISSKVLLSATVEGDLLEWSFTGPQGRVYTDSRVLSSGQNWVQAELDLSQLPSNETVGTWTLELFLNGIPQERQPFTVEPLTGLSWWGPFAGFGVLVFVVVIVGALIGVGLVVLIRVLKRNKEE